MPTTTSTDLADLHTVCALLPGGMCRATLHAASGLPDDVFTEVLEQALEAGQIVRHGQRYRAATLHTA